MKNFTVISDPGIDDLIALLLLKKLTPKSINTLIPTFGNGPLNVTLQNAKEFVAFAESNWNIRIGSGLPIDGKLEHPWPDYFHGPDGVWGVHPDTNIKNVKTISDFPNNNDLISLAPMHDSLNVMKGGLPANCMVMGGVFDEVGNETEYAETNIAFDPDAADVFFRICDNINVKVVPLDVTRKAFWDINVVKSIPENNKINTWLKRMLLTWFEKYDHKREKSFCLHDPLAVYLNFYPDKAKWEKTGVEVITRGVKRGATVRNSNNPEVGVALQLTDPQFISLDIFKIVFGSQ